jgi:hypothetical protein
MMHDVQLTAAIAAQGATRDLLEAERALRALAEEENRDLRAAQWHSVGRRRSRPGCRELTSRHGYF